MKHTASTTGLLALAASASATFTGMNYASTNGDGSARTSADFETYFKTQAKLTGTNGEFTSARLYTMIQGGTTADPISAIDAAIATNTTLLFGLWVSGDGFDNELTALKAAITNYGDKLTDVVAGISVGSEDLYRISPTGIAAKSGVGKGPADIVDYITQVRSTIKGTALSAAKIGHVDTWNAWVNGSNSAVIEACDWLGVDEYPYFQNTESNPVDTGAKLFQTAYENVAAVAGSKEIWVTETGWPTTGPTENLASASTTNAEYYWQTVACPLIGKTNVWWYILEDAGASPSFGVVADATNPTPLYNLACNSSASAGKLGADGSSSSTSTASASSSSATSGSSSSSGSGSSGSNSTSSGSGPSNSTTTGSSGSGSSATGVSAPSSTSSGGASSSNVAASGAGLVNAVSFGAGLLAFAAAVWAL